MPGASVFTEVAATLLAKVVAPLLLMARVPRRAVPPTAPLNATLPALLLIVSAWAPSTVLVKLTSPPVVLSAMSLPSVMAPVKVWPPVVATLPLSALVPLMASWLSVVVVPAAPSSAWPLTVSD